MLFVPLDPLVVPLVVPFVLFEYVLFVAFVLVPFVEFVEFSLVELLVPFVEFVALSSNRFIFIHCVGPCVFSRKDPDGPGID